MFYGVSIGDSTIEFARIGTDALIRIDIISPTQGRFILRGAHTSGQHLVTMQQ